jgi:membrane protein YdbS with pleckstrin-like domain
MKTNKNILSTIWLDFLTYIFMPLFILINSTELLKRIGSKNILLLIFLIVTIIYSIFTLYIVSSMKLNNIWYILEIFGGVSVLWIIPNYIYLYKRYEIFKHRINTAHIKKCPGCNRIIPVSMVSCGKCDYKE